jgi:hypothetical protein
VRRDSLKLAFGGGYNRMPDRAGSRQVFNWSNRDDILILRLPATRAL